MTMASRRVSPEVKVLYILGWGRTGSTLLDNLLGELDGFVSVGELAALWGQLESGARCGCGRPLAECERWSSVLDLGFGPAGGATRPDPAAVSRLVAQVVRLRKVRRLLRLEPGRDSGWPALEACLDVLARLYSGIARSTDARVIVDSSKNPAGGALLRLLSGVTPYYVQLVRDPRAVAYSWQRRLSLPDHEGRREMGRHDPLRSSALWTACNLGAEAVRRRHPSASLLLRYEDLIIDPMAALRAIQNVTGEPRASLSFVHGSRAHLHPNHTVGGNPSRFKTGTIEIVADDEWRWRQRPLHRLLATVPAVPLMRRYGYPVLLPPSDPRARPSRSTEA